MFKKLRQKIENADSTQDSHSSSGLSRPDESRSSSRSLSSNMKKTDSLSSLNSCDDMQPTDTTSREDLHSMLLNRTTQVKRLEVKLAEYGQSLKERSRECEKLSNALEKQQDTALRKINQLNETYIRDKKNSESVILRLENSEKELSTALESLKEENDSLKESVQQWKDEKEEFNQQKKEFYEKRDNSEELQDLQKQELAKLKHMLMNSEKEVKRLQEELDENVANLIITRDHNDKLETQLHDSCRSNESLQQTLLESTSQKDKLSNDMKESEASCKKLLNETNDYKDKLSCLALDMQKTRNSLSNIENAHNKLIDKYETLKHNSEAVLDQAQSDLEEKESLLTHLKNKLIMLEQRSSAVELPPDEQIQALIDERVSLEQKLEESHQQLVNIKSTWSDKINQLETQVSHLNSKIAEDCEELSLKQTELKQVKKEMTDKVSDLEARVATLKEENVELISHNEVVLQQTAEAETKLIEQKTIYEMELSRSRKREVEVEEQSVGIQKDLRKKIDQLSEKLLKNAEETKQTKEEYETTMSAENTKLDRLHAQLFELQDDLDKKSKELSNRERINSEMAISLEEVRRSRDEVKRKQEETSEELNQRQDQLHQANIHVQSMTEEVKSLTEQLRVAHGRVEAITTELATARHEASEKQLGLLQSKGSSGEKDARIEELSSKFNELEEHLENRTSELILCKEEVASLKNIQAEENEELERLRKDKCRLEDRILEKDRTLKLHQQRLNDVKKTLQKEINKKQQPGSLTHTGVKSQPPPSEGESAPSVNGVNPEPNPIPSLLSGDMTLDDPALSQGQKDVVIKYLKHVVLTFLSCGQSEAQQLIRAISAILKFTPDEEKLVREVFDYRTSWFSSRPNSKNVIKPSVKSKGRQPR